MYLDETPVTTTGALLDMHIYDVARVEALSGPQGTLYGASSLSGTLRIITNKPDTSKFSAGYDLQGNKFGKGGYGGTGEGFVNVPISPDVAVRLVGFYEHDGGYIDNTHAVGRRRCNSDGTGCVNGQPYTLDDDDPTTNYTPDNAKFVKNNFNTVDTYGGRAMLGIHLDDNWTITPMLVAQHQHTKGAFLYDPAVGDLEVHDFTPDHTTDKWYQAALTIEGKLGNWDVLYNGGYMQRKLNIVADYSYYSVYYDTYGASAGGYDITKFPDGNGGFLDPTQVFKNRQYISKQTHELRVSSPASDRFRLTAGLFYQRQADHNIADYDIPGSSTSPDPGVTPVFGDDVFYTNTHIVDKDYAAFGQASFDITPSLTLTGGLRGFIAHNTLTGFSGFASNVPGFAAEGVPGCVVPLPTSNSCAYINKKADESGETHKLTLQWQINPQKMIYATYSTGFRPGGNNRREGINPYAADTLDNYEVGWKTEWFGHTLRLNGAVYYEKWNKLQYALSPVGSAGVTNVYNAGDARVYGAEVDFAWTLFHHLTISGSGSYNDAKLTTDFCQIGADGNPDCSSGAPAAPKGTRLPIQPRFKGTLTARYEQRIGTIDAFLQASALHQSSTRSYLGIAEDEALGNTPSFTTVDFSLGGKFGNTTFEAFIQNAFDERGQLSRNSVCSPTYCGVYGRVYPVKPQQFGLKFGQKF